MTDDKDKKKKTSWIRLKKGDKNEKGEGKKKGHFSSDLIFTVLNMKHTTPQTQMISYSTHIIFIAGGYDTESANGYIGTNFAFGLKFIDDAPRKKVPYALHQIATLLCEENKNVEAGPRWELTTWKQKGVRLMNTRHPDTSSELFRTLNAFKDEPIFVAVFGKQNHRLIPKKISDNHQIHVYKHPHCREAVEGEQELEELPKDLKGFTEEYSLPNNWEI